MSRTVFFLLATLAVSVTVLVVGIRGYDAWAFPETALIFFLLGYALTHTYHRYVSSEAKPTGRLAGGRS